MRTHNKYGKWGQRVKGWSAEGENANAREKKNKDVKQLGFYNQLIGHQLQVFRLWGHHDREGLPCGIRGHRYHR